MSVQSAIRELWLRADIPYSVSSPSFCQGPRCKENAHPLGWAGAPADADCTRLSKWECAQLKMAALVLQSARSASLISSRDPRLCREGWSNASVPSLFRVFKVFYCIFGAQFFMTVMTIVLRLPVSMLFLEIHLYTSVWEREGIEASLLEGWRRRKPGSGPASSSVVLRLAGLWNTEEAPQPWTPRGAGHVCLHKPARLVLFSNHPTAYSLRLE